MNTYKFKGQKGITDLKFEHAFAGNSQGDTSTSNDYDDYLAAKGWMSFMFGPEVDMTNSAEIHKECMRRKEANAEYIKDLKEKGEYGDPIDYTISMAPNPIFDNPQKTDQTLESSKMIFIDMSTYGGKEI